MNFAKLLLAGSAAAALGVSAPAHAVSYVYVGSWYVGDGPLWADNPAVLNAVEAAALLFGGSASNYAISTIDSNVANINFMSHVDGWGDAQYLTSAVAQTFKLDTGNPGYNDPFGGPSYSAYVLDHSCFNRYSNPNEGCLTEQVGQNFAFRIVDGAVPEPGTWMMMLVGFLGLGAALRSPKRKPKVSVSYA